MNRYNMNKNQLQFTRKNFNKLHLKEIMNDDNLDKLENKEDKILLEKCFQYVYQSKDNLNQKKYKNKLFFVLVGYDEVSMETKNTPFGMCSISIDSTDDNYTKLVIFDLFKTVEGLDSDIFVKIFLKKIHDYYEKHFFVHSTSKKQYLIRELIVYIEPSKKSDTLANALTESKYTSVGKMVNLDKNSNKEFEEFTLPLNVDQLIKQNKNKNNSNSNNSSSNSNNSSSNSNKSNSNSNNSSSNSNKSNSNSNNGSSNRVENMTTNEIKNKTNNVQMNVSESIGPNITSNNGMMSVNDSIKSDDSNKDLFKEHNMSIEQNTNQQSQQKSTTDTPSTLETIQETGVQMNERLTKTINSGLQSISQFFSGKKEENSSTNKSNGTAMVVSSNSAQMSVNSPQQDKHRNVLVGGAKKKAKKAKKVKKAVKKTVKKKAVKKTSSKKTTAKNAPKKKVKKSTTSKRSKTANLKAASKKKTLKKPKHRGLFSILFR